MRFRCQSCGAASHADLSDVRVHGSALVLTCKTCGRELAVVGTDANGSVASPGTLPDLPAARGTLEPDEEEILEIGEANLSQLLGRRVRIQAEPETPSVAPAGVAAAATEDAAFPAAAAAEEAPTAGAEVFPMAGLELPAPAPLPTDPFPADASAMPAGSGMTGMTVEAVEAVLGPEASPVLEVPVAKHVTRPDRRGAPPPDERLLSALTSQKPVRSVGGVASIALAAAAAVALVIWLLAGGRADTAHAPAATGKTEPLSSAIAAPAPSPTPTPVAATASPALPETPAAQVTVVEVATRPRESPVPAPAEPRTGASPGPDAAAVDAFFARSLPGLRLCALLELRSRPGVALSDETITVTVTPSGEVTKVAFGKRGLAESDLGTCLAAELRKGRFDPFEGKPATFARTVTLQKGQAPAD